MTSSSWWTTRSSQKSTSLYSGRCRRETYATYGVLHKYKISTVWRRRSCRKNDMKKGDYTKLARKWMENSSKFQLDGLALRGLKIDRVELGFVRCEFVIPDHLLDREGNWNIGAISVLIDSMTAGAVFSITGGHLATVDYTMSFYSTAKVNEEVEIEAKIVGEKGNLVSVVTDITKKANGEKVVVGKQWMQATPINRSQAAKSKL